jgi:hypothetical protein
MSCKPMMALTSGVLETCVWASVTHGPSCVGRPARFFFMLVAHDPQGTAGSVAVPEPSQQGGRVRSCWPHDTVGVLPSREWGSEPWYA